MSETTQRKVDPKTITLGIKIPADLKPGNDHQSYETRKQQIPNTSREAYLRPWQSLALFLSGKIMNSGLSKLGSLEITVQILENRASMIQRHFKKSLPGAIISVIGKRKNDAYMVGNYLRTRI